MIFSENRYHFSGSCFILLAEHDLFRKPVSTFRDHALADTFCSPRRPRRSRVRTMKSAGIGLALLVVLAPCACLGQGAEQKPSPIDSADRLFQAGEFAQAGEQ